MSKELVGRSTTAVVTGEESAVKNGAERFVELCEAEDYVSFSDYSKFGHLNLGRPMKWKQGDFYDSLRGLIAEGSDEEGTHSDPKLCKENRRYTPCYAKSQSAEHDVKFEEGDTTKYFKKTRSGHWGFKYSKLNKFMKRYNEQINAAVTIIEEGREAAAALKKQRSELAKNMGCRVGEVEGMLMRAAYQELKKGVSDE